MHADTFAARDEAAGKSEDWLLAHEGIDKMLEAAHDHISADALSSQRSNRLEVEDREGDVEELHRVSHPGPKRS